MPATVQIVPRHAPPCGRDDRHLHHALADRTESASASVVGRQTPVHRARLAQDARGELALRARLVGRPQFLADPAIPRAAYEGLVCGFVRMMENLHLQVETRKVRRGSKRLKRI